MSALSMLAVAVRKRADQLEIKADEASKSKSPNVVTLLFAAVELHKIADEAERLATGATSPTRSVETGDGL